MDRKYVPASPEPFPTAGIMVEIDFTSIPNRISTNNNFFGSFCCHNRPVDPPQQTLRKFAKSAPQGD